MGRELEYKYKGTENAFAALQQRFAPFTEIKMETTYYDTPDAALSRRRWTLRRRMENEISVCTLKTPLPDGSRGEWEAEAPSIEEGIEALCNCGAPVELRGVTGLHPICGARFTRLAALVTLPDAKVELALDRGVLLGGGKEQPLLEIEAEYKEGREAVVRAFADALAWKFGLKEEPLSKFARARRLCL